MKNTLILALMLTACAPMPKSATTTYSFLTDSGSLYLGNGTSKQWATTDGRLSQQNQVEGSSTAIDLWPAPGVHPIIDSLAEITLHRTRWDEPTMERFNISAMATYNGAAYRFGVEASNGGLHRDIIFCFESADNGGPGFCPFRITQNGVFVCDQTNTCRAL